MTEQKYTLILYLGLCLIVLAAAQCTSDQINTCHTNSGLSPKADYGWPVLLNIPDQRHVFCTDMGSYISCIDGFSDECAFDQMELYATFENMGKFICDGDGLTEYETYYDVISNAEYRTQWQACVDAHNFDGTEDPTEVCDDLLPTYVECHRLVVPTDQPEAQTYVANFADASLADYYAYYKCNSGSSTAGVTSGVVIAILFAFFGSTFY